MSQKLSMGQTVALEIIAEQESRSATLLRHGVSGITLQSLDNRGLITLRHYANGWFWSITTAGRAALAEAEAAQ